MRNAAQGEKGTPLLPNSAITWKLYMETTGEARKAESGPLVPSLYHRIPFPSAASAVPHVPDVQAPAASAYHFAGL